MNTKAIRKAMLALITTALLLTACDTSGDGDSVKAQRARQYAALATADAAGAAK